MTINIRPGKAEHAQKQKNIEKIVGYLETINNTSHKQVLEIKNEKLINQKTTLPAIASQILYLEIFDEHETLLFVMSLHETNFKKRLRRAVNRNGFWKRHRIEHNWKYCSGKLIVDLKTINLKKKSLSVREVLRLIPGPTKSDTLSSRLAVAVTFLLSCVAQVLSRKGGLRHSSYAMTNNREYDENCIFDLKMVAFCVGTFAD